MKVVFLTTNLDPFAGWGRYSREVVARLPSLGVRPVVLVERGGRPSAPLPGVETYATLLPYAETLRNPARTGLDVARALPYLRGATLVHCLAEPHLFTAYLMSLMLPGRPLVTTAVGTYAISILDGRLGLRFRHAYRRSRAIPSISRYTGRRLGERMPELQARIEAIPLGVTMPVTAETAPPAREREQAFLAVGAVKRRKGSHLLVQALQRVCAQRPDAALYFVGDDRDTEYVGEVKRLAEDLGVAARIRWMGQLSEPDLAAVYRRVRGLVMPSLNHGKHFEGFGLVHLEANAVGVPAIGARDCGNEDAIADGRSGYLVRQGDIDDLAGAMLRLLGPDAAWDDLSRSSLEFARTMSWDRTAAGYADLYTRLRAAGKTRRAAHATTTVSTDAP